MSPNDPQLLPVFREGESVTVQRNVGGQNVVMVVEARDPCSINRHSMILRADIKLLGVSSHADERVQRQADSINRLLAHLQEHCTDPDCPRIKP